jgi:hypothetical protein
MNLSTRIGAFQGLGDEIRGLPSGEMLELCNLVRNENPWFTPENVTMALNGITSFLTEKELIRWTSKYPLEPKNPKTIGVAMAGNIPLAGFHDALCILISGNQLKAKTSSKDSILIKYLMERLVGTEPGFADFVSWEERLNGSDAVIATGGTNTARYFEYYFRSVPHIIRKNRSSCAIISGDESSADLAALGEDVFSYFGLGCRNISKIYVPPGYDFTPLLLCWEKYNSIIQHHKYANNYDYQRAIHLVNKIPFYDNGIILLKEEAAMVSHVSVLFYEYYTDASDLLKKVQEQKEKLQCIVSKDAWFTGSSPFGKAQFPLVSEYADGIDTLQFLETLN